MPKSVKKNLKPVHPLSRKALQLSRKEHHNEKLERRKDELNIKQKIKLKKLLWFKTHVNMGKSPYSADDLVDLIYRYLHRFDEEIEKNSEAKTIKGRKNTTHMKQEYALNFVAEREIQDYNTCGLEVPDLMNKRAFETFLAWNGEPKYLTSIKMSTVSQTALINMVAKKKGNE